MSDAAVPALRVLSTKLCLWLRPSLGRLDAARASERLGHAWLITGAAGVGKLNLALVFAHRLLSGISTAEPVPLDPAEAVAAMRERHTPVDHHPDLHWLFPEEEKRTISVDQVRDMTESLNLKSHGGGAKIVVIEPADALTPSAANALLKTLEEPSDDTYLLLVCHQPDRLPATIRSRCQRLHVPRPSADEVVRWVGDGPEAVAAAWLTRGSPLQTAALVLSGSLGINEISIELTSVSEDRAEIHPLAATWAKSDPELALTWLARELHREIRGRLAPSGSTSVTDPGEAALHNAWAKLTLRRLFEQYETAGRLLNQLSSGSGLNLELALHAMLLGFQGNRGPS